MITVGIEHFKINLLEEFHRKEDTLHAREEKLRLELCAGLNTVCCDGRKKKKLTLVIKKFMKIF